MKISCNREKLAVAFQVAAAVAPSRSPKEILQNIKLEATEEQVMLIATDMDAGVRIHVEGVDVHTPGKTLLSTQRVGSIIRESSDEQLEIETTDSGLSIKGLQSEFNLPSSNPDEFPTVTSFEEESYFEIPARLFRELIRRTVFATDTESSRYALGGVLLEIDGDEITAIGTDGRRLAKMQGAGKSIGGHKTTGATTIVPTKTLSLMERSIGDKEEIVHLAARQNDVLVRTSRGTIYSRLVEGRYPNWRQVIPKRDECVTIEGIIGPFYAALRQASVVADPDSRGVDFQFGEGSLVVAARTADVGQSRIEIPISYTGEIIKLMMDHRYVADFLKALDSDTAFEIDISTSAEPALFKTADGYEYVVMPMARDR
jgi:DNA polymerase-3 subunit beta